MDISIPSLVLVRGSNSVDWEHCMAISSFKCNIELLFTCVDTRWIREFDLPVNMCSLKPSIVGGRRPCCLKNSCKRFLILKDSSK